MNTKKTNGIQWGPFTLRIPFIHMSLLTGEFLQGLVISGATALAGAPVAMAFGLNFEEALENYKYPKLSKTCINLAPIIPPKIPHKATS